MPSAYKFWNQPDILTFKKFNLCEVQFFVNKMHLNEDDFIEFCEEYLRL